jgi:hypothetical protein
VERAQRIAHARHASADRAGISRMFSFFFSTNTSRDAYAEKYNWFGVGPRTRIQSGAIPRHRAGRAAWPRRIAMDAAAQATTGGAWSLY